MNRLEKYSLNNMTSLYVDYLHELSLKTLLSYKVCKVVIIMKKFS